MPTDDPDPLSWLKRLTESYRQVRLGRGVVGKTGYVMMGLMGVLGVVAWKWSGQSTDLGLFGIAVLAAGVVVWWVRSIQAFAERNPAQAMLEGAEFIEYQKFEAQAKGLPKLEDAPLVEGHPTSGPLGEDRG
jgi:hypothetical protein